MAGAANDDPVPLSGAGVVRGNSAVARTTLAVAQRFDGTFANGCSDSGLGSGDEGLVLWDAPVVEVLGAESAPATDDMASTDNVESRAMQMVLRHTLRSSVSRMVRMAGSIIAIFGVSLILRARWGVQGRHEMFVRLGLIVGPPPLASVGCATER